MKRFCAAIFLCCLTVPANLAMAKETCAFAWGKGSFKSHKQVESELRELLSHAKILRLSLCRSGDDNYFDVTILEATGRVRTLRVPAR